MSIFQTPLFLWSVIGVAVVPLLVVILNELLDRMKRHNHVSTPVIQFIRDAVLPSMVLLFMLRFIVGVDDANVPAQLISTLAWGVAIWGVIRLSRIVLNGKSGWQAQIPSFALRLPTLIIVGTILVHIVQNVWGQPLNELATTLGLGSVIIAFALQDTLSRIVSGLLMVVNSPLAVGEWVHVREIEGKVLEVNWRYTYIGDREGNLIVIPNSSIADELIVNYSRPSTNVCIVRRMKVAYSSAPNKVKQMFFDVMENTDGILETPVPTVAVTEIDDPTMEYELRYWIADIADQLVIEDRFMTRIWYAAQRHGVAFPSPAYDMFHYDGPQTMQAAEVTPAMLSTMLRDLSTFDILPDVEIDQLAASAKPLHFAASERILHLDKVESGIYVLLSGEVSMSVLNHEGDSTLYKHLYRGDFFGESGIFGRSASQMNIDAQQDVELILLEYQVFNNIINRHPTFSAEINAVITEREHAIQRLIGENEPAPQTPFAINLNGAIA